MENGNCTRPDFNPRSREGSDKEIPRALSRWLDFNPRSREGSDRAIFSHVRHICISIHAPAKGATGMEVNMQMADDISIHAPAKGATGGRSKNKRDLQNFNPRSREGSDLSRAKSCFITLISIHAPAKGATCNVFYGWWR